MIRRCGGPARPAAGLNPLGAQACSACGRANGAGQPVGDGGGGGGGGGSVAVSF